MLFFAQFDPGHWLSFPLVRLGDAAITPLLLLQILVWVSAVVAANILIRRLVLQRLLARTHFDAGLRFAITRIFGYVFLSLGFYVALVVHGVNLSSLAVVAGALGIGVGLGLQNIVGNFVSGLVLLAERPIAIGDRIEVSGVAGNVTRINLRSTLVLTNDNITIIVPNSELTSHPITNWNHGDPRVRVRIPIGVAYGTDPEFLRRTLLGVARENPEVLRTPEPAIFFESFGDSSLNFELGVWTETMSHNPRRFRSDLNFAIERALRENGIEIPFPQRVVHWRNDGVAQEMSPAPDLASSTKAPAPNLNPPAPNSSHSAKN